MKTAASQIAFRYRPQDSATGVTRTTTKRLADVLGVDETQVIHLALHELAKKFLPQYEGDIVWCRFPDNIYTKPKPPPGLIISTKEDDQGIIFVSVAYGTSQNPDCRVRLCGIK